MTGIGDEGRRERFAAVARGERPALDRLCLLVGAEADPGLGDTGIAHADRVLDTLAAEVARCAAGTDRTPEAWARALREVLGVRHGFHGREADYGLLASSLLHRVLDRRRGLPILLSVVWIEVGRRAGAPVHGIALPGHFVAGIGLPGERQVLVDPFRGGAPLSQAEAAELVVRATGQPPARDDFGPADPLDVVARVLNNIRNWAAARPEHSAVGLWAVDLSLLLPRHPARLRLDRARLLVERGEFARGAAELDTYAEVVHALDPTAAERLRHQARAARALLN